MDHKFTCKCGCAYITISNSESREEYRLTYLLETGGLVVRGDVIIENII